MSHTFIILFSSVRLSGFYRSNIWFCFFALKSLCQTAAIVFPDMPVPTDQSA